MLALLRNLSDALNIVLLKLKLLKTIESICGVALGSEINVLVYLLRCSVYVDPLSLF